MTLRGKIILWAVIAFLVYFMIQAPDGFASLLGGVINIFVKLANALITLLGRL